VTKRKAAAVGAPAPALPPAWPATQVEMRAPGALKAHPQNSRTHSAQQVEQICASLREFGFTIPLLVDEADTIIAGHGRQLAALKEGLAEVPCLVARGWSEAQKRAYIIADNKLTLNGDWDDAKLREELAALQELDFNLQLTGFSDAELAKLLKVEGLGGGDADAVPEPAGPTVARPGDVWVLGAHRIVCGDSTTVEAVTAALGGGRPHLMVTDPPYGVAYDPAWRDGKEPRGARRASGKIENDGTADWRGAWALFPGDVAYVWHAALRATEVDLSLRDAGFEVRAQIVWDKGRLVLGRGDYQWQHEACWYAVKKGKAGHWAGDRKQTTVWQIPMNWDAETGHAAQKPVLCMLRPIENNSAPGDTVYDPFLGSGTTLIACEQTGRACRGIEIAPAHVDIAILRWQDLAKSSAVLEATGQSFVEVMAERAPGAPIGLKPPKTRKRG
jgi:DNA modification methylase